MSDPEAKPMRHLVVAGLAVTVVAVLALAGHPAVRPAGARATNVQASVSYIEHADYCQTIPWSCSELSTVTNPWLVGEGSVTVGRHVVLRPARLSIFDAPSDAVVLVPKRPPRRA